ncbi:MAG: hypothetical protein JWO06_2128 [Bacteroidota bacterium]|nr:hypothetical protein [Bacteroidota bacterium]
MRLKHLVIILLSAPLFNYGQDGFYNKGSDIYIQKEALMAVQGDFVNSLNGVTGSVQNDGTIELTGNFINNSGAKFGVYNNSASKDRVVKFVGSGTQLIKGSMSTAGHSSFYNLLIDKVYASDTVEMQTPVVVEGSLIFGSANTSTTYNPIAIYTNYNQKGLFKTYSSTAEYLLDIQNGNVDAISGYPVLDMGGTPSSGFIVTSGIRASADGGLQRKIASATSYVFPVGTSGKGFNGVRLNFSQVPGGGSVKTKFCDGSSNPTGYVGHITEYCADCPSGALPTNQGYNRYFSDNGCNGGNPQWVILEHTAKDHGYWSFASTNTGYKYDMEVFANSYLGSNNPGSTWRVIKHESSYGDDPSLASVDWRPEIETLPSTINDLTTYTLNAGCYSGTGVPGGNYTDFSHFVLGMTGESNALPVKFIYVKADPAGKHHIKVSWATAIEVNNAGFEVMRSTDGTNFSDVGWVDGHNNSTVNQTYAFDDKVSQGNIPYYYKLRQVDNNKVFAYSDIVEAKLTDDEQAGFALYPNPTANDLILNISNPGEEVKVSLFDIQGRLVYENIFTAEQSGGSQTFTITAARVLPPGTYILNAVSNGAQYKEKVILQ